MHHLEALSGNGDPDKGKLALWTRYQSSPAHPNHTVGLMSPVTILDKDYDFMEACLEIVNKRNYRENNPSAAKRQIVSETSFSSPPYSSHLPQPNLSHAKPCQWQEASQYLKPAMLQQPQLLTIKKKSKQ